MLQLIDKLIRLKVLSVTLPVIRMTSLLKCFVVAAAHADMTAVRGSACDRTLSSISLPVDSHAAMAAPTAGQAAVVVVAAQGEVQSTL